MNVSASIRRGVEGCQSHVGSCYDGQMNTIDPTVLFIVLGVLLIVSAFFSGTETAMMALNRYRLRHQARKGNRAAQRVTTLLSRPDRLLGVVLLGNQFANISASAIATVLCVHYFGDLGVLIATFSLTFVVLVFAEAAPKTLAVLHPTRLAFPAAWLLQLLLWVLYPVVWVINVLANSLLAIFGVRVGQAKTEPLSREELKTLVVESSGKMQHKYQHMLLRVLDLEHITIEDVMVPRNEITGIDLQADWDTILYALRHSEHAHVPLYEESLDHVKGVLKLRKLIEYDGLTRDRLLSLADPVYFVPEAAQLSRQLLHFQDNNESVGLVVDEYGEIQGLVTIRDILQEIVGEFGDYDDSVTQLVRRQADGSVVVDGSITIRELNRVMDWQLPLEHAKTLSGLIIHYLEMIPQASVACRIDGYPMEVIKANAHTIQLVQVWSTVPRIQSD